MTVQVSTQKYVGGNLQTVRTVWDKRKMQD